MKRNSMMTLGAGSSKRTKLARRTFSLNLRGGGSQNLVNGRVYSGLHVARWFDRALRQKQNSEHSLTITRRWMPGDGRSYSCL